MAACVAASLGLHGLFLSMRIGPPPEVGGAGHAPVRTRLIAAEAPRAQVLDRREGAATHGTRGSVSREAPERSASQSEVRPMAPVAGAVAAPEDAQGDYLPRSRLTVAPRPLAPVVIPAVEDPEAIGQQVGTLSLFIDEQGRVQEVVGDAPLLPPAMAQAARDTFMQARFSPGELHGRAVKSRLRVEAVFDSAVTDVSRLAASQSPP